MNESLGTHLELAGLIITVVGGIVIPIWLNIRSESRRDREMAQQRHVDNVRELTEIKTLISVQMTPLYSWWIKKIGNGGTGD